MFELKSFPSSFTSVHSQKRKEKKKFFSSSVTLPIFLDKLLSRQFHIFSLPPFPFSVCNRVTVNVSQSWSRVIWRASRGGIEHGKGKEKYAFTLLDSNCQDRGRIPRSTGKTRKFSFEPPFIFSPRAPHLFTFRSPPGSSTRRKEKIEHPLNFLFPWGHSRRPLGRAFLIIFDSLENPLDKGTFRSVRLTARRSIAIRLFRIGFTYGVIISFRSQSFVLKCPLVLREKFFSIN